MKTIKYLSVIFVLAALYACGDDNMNQPRGSSVIPEQVTVREVVNISGASIIYYDRPADENLLYVKAVYTTDDGVEMDATASFYTDSIVVRGFRDACSVDVLLYSVNAMEGMSKPVKVPVNPETPPYLEAFEKLEINPTFRGVVAATENVTNAKLSIVIEKLNPVTNKFEEIGLKFSDVKKLSFAVKGQVPDVAQTYRAKIRDQFGHWSETKEATIVPWFEKLLDRSKFQEVRRCYIASTSTDPPGNRPWPFDENDPNFNLPSNFWGHFMHWWSGSNVRFDWLWDGEKGNNTSKCYHTKGYAPLPQHFTMDLGKEYSLSRIVIWGRFADATMPEGSTLNPGTGYDDQHVFRNGFPKRIKLYGGTYTGPNYAELKDDINNPEYWTDLGEYVLLRADGSTTIIPGNTNTSFATSNGWTAEDRALIQQGHEFDLPVGMPKYRYFRFQTWECYNPAVTSVMLGEIALYGND